MEPFPAQAVIAVCEEGAQAVQPAQARLRGVPQAQMAAGQRPKEIAGALRGQAAQIVRMHRGNALRKQLGLRLAQGRQRRIQIGRGDVRVDKAELFLPQHAVLRRVRPQQTQGRAVDHADMAACAHSHQRTVGAGGVQLRKRGQPALRPVLVVEARGAQPTRARRLAQRPEGVVQAARVRQAQAALAQRVAQQVQMRVDKARNDRTAFSVNPLVLGCGQIGQRALLRAHKGEAVAFYDRGLRPGLRGVHGVDIRMCQQQLLHGYNSFRRYISRERAQDPAYSAHPARGNIQSDAPDTKPSKEKPAFPAVTAATTMSRSTGRRA